MITILFLFSFVVFGVVLVGLIRQIRHLKNTVQHYNDRAKHWRDLCDQWQGYAIALESDLSQTKEAFRQAQRQANRFQRDLANIAPLVQKAEIPADQLFSVPTGYTVGIDSDGYQYFVPVKKEKKAKSNSNGNSSQNSDQLIASVADQLPDLTEAESKFIAKNLAKNKNLTVERIVKITQNRRKKAQKQ